MGMWEILIAFVIGLLNDKVCDLSKLKPSREGRKEEVCVQQWDIYMMVLLRSFE